MSEVFLAAETTEAAKIMKRDSGPWLINTLMNVPIKENDLQRKIIDPRLYRTLLDENARRNDGGGLDGSACHKECRIVSLAVMLEMSRLQRSEIAYKK
ncbi:unnamed protein product [Brassica oleracea var. botrytis]|uniref:(rape) hypothetical protein n=1 Tax=Brassica napus TaxID=3708 RepID=A0A816IF51_BRANA|nr:unnamed protein product [Brassica napus]